MARSSPRVAGTAIFLTGNPQGTPGALLHNLKHNKVLHERIIFLTVESELIPFIDEEKRNIGTHAEPASLRNLDDLLARGDFDLVAVGRSLIPNPDWPKLIAAGRESELRAYDKSDLDTLV